MVRPEKTTNSLFCKAREDESGVLAVPSRELDHDQNHPTLLFLTAGLLAAAELPKSVAMACGGIRIRPDARKRWNIDRIEWKDRLVCIDTPGAHCG